ncbi:MAG: GNAT family N-acetyltransferase [Devosia sp.]|nr:GNAT family N-acetyltransferase [Devosia sp.]
MSALDLGTVEAIAEVVHEKFYEAPAVLAEKRDLYPNGAHILEIGERPVGYVLSHPWKRASIPALNARLGAIPGDADSYYIHDLALLPVARRIGAAQFIVGALAKHAEARGFATMSLVAVNGSEGFWARQGFVAEDVPELTGKLLSYGEGARYMVRELAALRQGAGSATERASPPVRS